MPDASVNIGGSAAGGLAAVAAMQGAIDGLHGKTVEVGVNVRHGGGAGDLGKVASDMDRLGHSADKARGHVDRLNESSNKAHTSVRKLGDRAGAASDHVGHLGDSSRESAGHVERLGHSSAGVHDSVSQLGVHAKSASGSVGGLGTRANTASGHLDKLGASASNAHDPLQAIGGLLSNLGGGGRGGGSGSGGGSLLGGLLPQLGPATAGLKTVGLVAGVSALGIGALGAAVAGVGLAGVAEDFAHNSQLMHQGEQAIRGFNREFSKMKGETTAAGSGPMAGVASSMKGAGHELAQIGAANIGPVLNDVSSLGNQATAAMHKLAPSIGPATQGLTSLAGAVIGAFGDSGPAVTSFANSITSHAPQIQAGLSSIVNVASGLGSMAVDTVAAFGAVDNAVQNMVQPGGKPGAEVDGNTIKKNMDKMLGARRDPSTGAVDSIGHWGDYDADTGAPKPGSPAAAGFARNQNQGYHWGGGAGGAGKAVAPGQFNPSQPFSGMLPDGQGGFTAGPGEVTPAKAPKPYSPSPDAARFSGMTGGQILTQQRADAGLPPVGQPMYSGLGPRGGGQSVGPMPASAAIGLGGGSIAPFNDMMRAQVAGGGASTGAGLVQHIQKAVQVAAPAASAGGAAIGGAINAGTAQGSQSTQSVVDTVIIKHSKHIIDIASAALGIRSPSTEFDYLGRMTSQGYAQGIVRESHRAGTAAVGLFGHAKSGYDYQDGSDPVVSVRKQPSYDDFQAAQQAQQDAADRKASFGNRQGAYQPGSEGWWSAHDNRAGQLQAGSEGRQRAAIGGMTHDERRDQLLRSRSDNHERALANLGAPGHKDPFRDPNSAMNNVNPFVGTTRDPLAGIKSGAAGRFQGMYNQAGQASAMGLTQGMNAHVGKVQAAGANLAGAGHGGYRKKDKQASPSAAWAEMAGNSVAGAVGGMNAGGPALAAAGAGAAAAMAGPLNNQGLQIGYSFATNVVDGATRTFKNTNLQASGTPQIANQQAAAALGRLGLLGAGAGASVYATPSVSESGAGVAAQIAAAVKAAGQSQPIHIYLDSQLIQTMIRDGQSNFIEQFFDASKGTNG